MAISLFQAAQLRAVQLRVVQLLRLSPSDPAPLDRSTPQRSPKVNQSQGRRSRSPELTSPGSRQEPVAPRSRVSQAPSPRPNPPATIPRERSPQPSSPIRNRTRRSRRTPALLPPPQPVHQFRLFITWLLLVLGMGGMGYRLYYLQIRDTANLLERANAQQNTVLHPVLPRRQIVDRFGTVLALDQPRYSLYAHPTLFSESLEDVATGLAPLLQGGGMETDAATLLAQFMSQDSGIRLSDSLPESVADSIRNLGWNGLDLEKHQQRIYPNGTLFSQILGYVDWEGTAQNGLEASELARLTRSKPDTTARRMGNGTLLPDNLPLDFLAQDTLKLQLTLDSRLQQATQTILQAQLDKFAAKRGAVIIMDVRDGSLLALATLPTYDANHYYDANFDYFRNWALSDLYEPGSTFKPLNVAIALELGGIQAEDTIYDEGQIQVGGWPIANHDFESAGGHGVLSITEVLKYSSNMGMVHIIQSLDPGQYHDALTRLGIGQPLETDLPQVATGYLKSREVMTTSSADRATTSFGQGLTVTPLQMVQLHGALANGGRRVTPHIIQGLVDSKGEQQWTPDYPETDVFKPETTRKVLDMMEAVVRDSTQVATIPGYRIGGKTGTAQKAENGVYIAGAKITSFVGIVPIEQPRYVVFAVVDEPQGANTFGSTVAAPVVRQVMETLTLLYGVQPSDPQVVGTNPPGAIE